MPVPGLVRVVADLLVLIIHNVEILDRQTPLRRVVLDGAEAALLVVAEKLLDHAAVGRDVPGRDLHAVFIDRGHGLLSLPVDAEGGKAQPAVGVVGVIGLGAADRLIVKGRMRAKALFIICVGLNLQRISRRFAPPRLPDDPAGVVQDEVHS